MRAPLELSYKGGGKEVESQDQELEESCPQGRTGRQNNQKMLEKPLTVPMTTEQELSRIPPWPLQGFQGHVVFRNQGPAVRRRAAVPWESLSNPSITTHVALRFLEKLQGMWSEIRETALGCFSPFSRKRWNSRGICSSETLGATSWDWARDLRFGSKLPVFGGAHTAVYPDSGAVLNAEWPWSSGNPGAQVQQLMVLKIKQNSPQGVEIERKLKALLFSWY